VIHLRRQAERSTAKAVVSSNANRPAVGSNSTLSRESQTADAQTEM
jgi:hypothetical protein